MTEVDVLLELERKLNAHAADHPLCVECAEAQRAVEAQRAAAASRPPAMVGDKRNAFEVMRDAERAQSQRINQEVRWTVVVNSIAEPPPPRAPTRPHLPLRAPARPHAPPCVQHHPPCGINAAPPPHPPLTPSPCSLRSKARST